MVHLGPDNGSGERQAGPVVGGEGGLGEQSARVGGVARGGELSEVAAVPGQEDDVDVVAQGPGAGPGGQPDGAGEHNAADGPAGDGDEREPVGAADDQPPLAHVDARAVAADVDDLVGVGGALDVMVGVDGRAGAGEVDSEEAEALVEGGHGGLLLVEVQSVGGDERAEQLAGGQQVVPGGGAHDDVVGEAGVAVSGVVQDEVGQQRRQAGALGDAATASAALPAGAAGPGDEADEVDGARTADDGGEDRQGVLDVEVGEVVLDVGAQDVAVAVVAQGGEVVDGVVGSDAGAVGEGAGGHDPVGVVRDGVDDGALDDAVADGGDVQDAGLAGSALGDVGAQERGGEVGALAQGGGQLGEEAVEVSGDEAGLALEEAVAGVPDQDHLPGAGQALDRAEAFEGRGRGGGGRGGGLGGVGEGGAQRVEILAEVLVRAGECRAVGATAAMEGAGSSARGVRGARGIRLFAVSGGFRIHLHCTPWRVSQSRVLSNIRRRRRTAVFEHLRAHNAPQPWKVRIANPRPHVTDPGRMRVSGRPVINGACAGATSSGAGSGIGRSRPCRPCRSRRKRCREIRFTDVCGGAELPAGEPYCGARG